MFWSIANWCAVGLFTVAALLQINDVDPWKWYGLYSYAALTALVFVYRPRWSFPYVLGASVFGLFVLFALMEMDSIDPSLLFGSMDDGYDGSVKQMREAVGLLCAMCWCLALAIRSFYISRDRE